MADKNNNLLASFMKKQIGEKSQKNSSIIAQSITGDANSKKDQTKESGDKPEKKLSEKEEAEKKELEQAKLESKSKAAQMDQTEMLKKLLIQNIVKFTVIIGSMLILAYGVIEVGPKVIASMNGIFLKAIVGSAR